MLVAVRENNNQQHQVIMNVTNLFDDNISDELEQLVLRPEQSEQPSPRRKSRESPVRSPARITTQSPQSSRDSHTTSPRKPHVRWVDEAEDQSLGPTPTLSVSKQLSSACIGLNIPSVKPQDDSFSGGSGGMYARDTSTWLRVPLNAFPVFDGGNFFIYYQRISAAMNTYPEAERYPIFAAKLGDNVIECLCDFFPGGLGHCSFEQVVQCLLMKYREHSKPPIDSSLPRERTGKYEKLSMKNVPIFQGESGEDFDIWFRRVSMYLDTYPPQERIHRLCSQLGTKPFEFVQHRPDEVLNSFDMLVESLRRKYVIPINMSRAQELFYSRYQRNSEDLQDFEGELRRLVRIAFPAQPSWKQEEAILQRMLAGTSNVELSRHFTFSPPLSIEHLYHAADLIKKNRLLNSDSRVEVSRPTGGSFPLSGSSFQKNMPPYRSADVRRSLSPIRPPTPPSLPEVRRSPSPVRALRPPTPPRRSFSGEERTDEQVKCFKCGEKGHFMRNCPFRGNRYLNH